MVGTLQKVMTKNTYLRVFVAAGLYDLTTPYYSNVYMINHFELDSSLRKNIKLKLYYSGHQNYTSQLMLKELTGDAANFFNKSQ